MQLYTSIRPSRFRFGGRTTSREFRFCYLDDGKVVNTYGFELLSNWKHTISNRNKVSSEVLHPRFVEYFTVCKSFLILGYTLFRIPQ